MKVTLAPYVSYKDSGVSWLGPVPQHWDLKRLGSIFAERAETNDSGKVTQILSVMRDIGVVRYEDKGNVGNKASDDIRRYKIVRPDDLVINCMNVIIGSLGLSRYTGCLSPVYYVLSLRSANDSARYFEYIFKNKVFHQSLVRIGSGILAHRMRIPMELMKCEIIPQPPKEEQNAIVRFLTAQDVRFSRLIQTKRRMIELLNEQKSAIIHRAVTRGLDPNVRLKPSGLPWLGDIPEHWEVIATGKLARVGNGSTPSRGNSAFWNSGDVPWLNSSSVNQTTIDKSTQFVTQRALRECHLPIVAAQSILMAITGQGKTRGKVALLNFQSTINQHLAYITPKSPKCSSEYLLAFLTASYFQLRALSEDSGSTKGAITCADVKRFKIALPPSEEQTEIVHQVNMETQKIASALSRIQREIDLILEYRTRLISDVVTGQLDVRQAAAQLPDITLEDVEPLTMSEETDEAEEQGADDE